ncbi:TPA: hypothetical protein ACH3X3_007990 [Trebouxia sp. C0006]
MHVKARLRHKIEWLACTVQLMFCDQLVAGNGIPNSTNAYMLHKQIKRQIDVLSSLPLLPFHLTLMVFAIAKCRHSVVNPKRSKRICCNARLGFLQPPTSTVPTGQP